MRYILQFLTEKGEEAYKIISNVRVPLRERMITNKIFREKEIDDNPLTIEINVLIPWLAVQEQIDQKIIDQLSSKGCERDLDYTLEVS